MKRLVYSFKTLVDPKKVEVRVDDDFYTYSRWTPEDWPTLLSIARAAGRVFFKEATKQELTENEKLAKNLFWGIRRPRLSIGENGKIEVSDGRHRMQALKETNTILEMEISADVYIEKLQNIGKAMVVGSQEFDFSYLLFEKMDVLQHIPGFKDVFVSELYDIWDRRSYYVISRTDFGNKNVQEMVNESLRKGVSIYTTKEKIGKDILKDER